MLSCFLVSSLILITHLVIGLKTFDLSNDICPHHLFVVATCIFNDRNVCGLWAKMQYSTVTLLNYIYIFYISIIFYAISLYYTCVRNKKKYELRSLWSVSWITATKFSICSVNDITWIWKITMEIKKIVDRNNMHAFQCNLFMTSWL